MWLVGHGFDVLMWRPHEKIWLICPTHSQPGMYIQVKLEDTFEVESENTLKVNSANMLKVISRSTGQRPSRSTRQIHCDNVVALTHFFPINITIYKCNQNNCARG